MKRLHSILIYFALFTSTSLYAQQSVENYIEESVSRDPIIQAYKSEIQAAEKRVGYIGKLPDPTVMATAFVQPVQTRVGPQRASVAFSQPLPWKGKLDSRKSVAAQMIAIKNEQIKAREQELTKNIYQAWLDMYYLKFQGSLLKETMSWYEQIKEISTVKLQSGSGSSIDVLQVEIELLKYQRDLENLEEEKDAQHEHWKMLMNNNSQSYPEHIELPEFRAGSFENLVEIALDSNNQVRILDEIVKQRELEITMAAKEGMPDFTLGASYINIAQRTDIAMEGNGSDAWLFPQIGIKIPLYRAKYRYQVQEKEFLAEAERHRVTQVKNNISNDLGREYSNYQKLLKNLETDGKLIELNEQVLELMLSEYSSDLRNFEDLLLVESRLVTLKLKAEKAKVDLQKSLANLYFISGINF